MSFNNGNERRKLNAKWEHLRVQYREAGMSEDAIQAMYEFDLGVLNSERAYITNTMTVSDDADDCTAKETSDFKQSNCLLYDGFFSFAVVRQLFLSVLV